MQLLKELSTPFEDCQGNDLSPFLIALGEEDLEERIGVTLNAEAQRDLISNSIEVQHGQIGLVSNIQDFVVHDGPGLRVLVFLSGCPLRCQWCQNPENIEQVPQIVFRASLCQECLKCAEACPIPETILKDKEKRIDRSKCIRCMKCVEVCPQLALQKVGEWMTVEQVLGKVLPYKPFFDHSDQGGVTLSGGDPMSQPEFTLRLLESFKKFGIHSTVETCGYGKYEMLKRIAELSDLIIYDLKHMDENCHITGTGVTNRTILNNLEKLCEEMETEIAIHIPLIPGFNDGIEHINKIAKFITSLRKTRHVDLLPFNELASGKYSLLGLDWVHAKTKRQSPEHLDRLKKVVESYGLEVTIGGLW
jgi:pyruvate formate lyase activating enzyme